jgi:hypothetical protein
MLDLDELSAHLQVQTNILNEKRIEIAKREQAARAMEEAKNK